MAPKSSKDTRASASSGVDDITVQLPDSLETDEQPVSESEAEETESSDGESTDGTQDEEQKSTDGQEKDKDKDKDDKDDAHDEQKEGTTENTMALTIQFDEEADAEITDEHFRNLLAVAESEGDFLMLKMLLMKRAKFYYDLGITAEKSAKSLTKERKKKERAEAKKTQKEGEKTKKAQELSVPVHINIRIGTENIVVEAHLDDTVGPLRKSIINILKRGSTKKSSIKTSNIGLKLGEVFITEHPRMTLVKDGLSDGCVLTLVDGIRGGGKRGSAETRTSFDEKCQELIDEISLGVMRVSSSATPFAKETMAIFADAKNKVIASPDDFIKHLKTLPLENLKKSLSVIQSTNIESRYTNLAKLMFKDIQEKLVETQKCLIICEKSSRQLVQLMLLKKFGSEEKPTINWVDFNREIIELVSEKSKTGGDTNMS